MSRERDLVRFCCELTFDDFSQELIEHTRLVIMDAVGVIVGGFYAYPLFKRWAEESGRTAPGPATILGAGIKAEEGYAALANGMAGTSLELDEGNRFCGGHPSMHVIPAALAISEAENRNGREFLTAIVAGYEIASRIGRAITPLRWESHPHGTWGVVGAAVAVGRLQRLDENQVYQAASIASNYSLNTSFDTALEGATVRESYCGLANSLGILSVRLSRSGLVGLNEGIVRQYAHLGETGFQESCLMDSLGEIYEISRNYFKIHAACRYTHGALDALDQIIASHGPVPVNDIAGIEARTYKAAARLCNPIPKNALQAKFSLPYAIAARLSYGSSGIDSFKEESITAAVVELAQKVTVSENPHFSSQLPDKRPTEVILHFHDGHSVSSVIDIPAGDNKKAYSPEVLKKKFMSLLSPYVGPRKAGEALKLIETIEEIDDLRKLTCLLS
jgi:2-methylcitrate dehydratase PrpD